MNEELERYLNDHLAGASGAVTLLTDLADRQQAESDREFFLKLKEAVEGDQSQLKSLLNEGGMKKSKTLQAAGTIAAKAGRLKFLWEGLEPGGLGMFEALEALALGIQGKRLLWVMLAEIAPQAGCWPAVDFAELEREALRQRDAVEKRRIEAGRASLGALEGSGT